VYLSEAFGDQSRASDLEIIQEGMTMKAVYRNIIRSVLYSGLLLGTGVLASAQEPSAQEPSTQQASPAPDNTKVNERDRSQNEPTADQQKDNRSDRDITQQIRQSIMKDKSLSTYAHNVKIVTQDGEVTLKGPVRSEDEKQAIEAKAIEVAGDGKVTSELNIKPQQ
jgi:hyperosmotically inducible periplasmic protein